MARTYIAVFLSGKQSELHYDCIQHIQTHTYMLMMEAASQPAHQGKPTTFIHIHELMNTHQGLNPG